MGARVSEPPKTLYLFARLRDSALPEMSGRIKNSVGPVGLKTVLMTLVTTGLLTVDILFACICQKTV